MKAQYIKDEKGKKIAVVLPVDEYKQILEKLEMLSDITAYDKVMEVNEPSVPYGKAVKEIAAKRKGKK